ncbi:MAG: aminopeptidase P family protein [Acidobacteriaceae bacterium]|nr:aminopeptidase P family protein [Acidobacteriaceae bacterium]
MTTNSPQLPLRRGEVIPALHEAKAQAFLTTALPNVRYLTNFTGSNGALLLTEDRALLFTDPRYATQAPQESDCEVKVAKGPLLKEVAKWIKRLQLKSLAFEQNRISFEDYGQLKEHAKNLRLKPLNGLVETLRAVKSEAEIAAIRNSVQLNSTALEQSLRHFKPSMTEIDLAAEIDYRMRRLGAEGPAFETIVASGKRSALPHARPTEARIQTDELLLIDMGAIVAGYASDMTRAHAVGKLDTKRQRMYRAVLESQLAALEAIKPGVTCANVDRVARDVLRGFGLDKLFVHSTGHGLGLEIHERPRVGRKDKTKLVTGMVITVEPGVYEEGFGGVRIEDTVVVTASGCEVLTPTKKELLTL